MFSEETEIYLHMLPCWEKSEKARFASNSVPLRANGKILKVSIIIIIWKWHYIQIAAERDENIGTPYEHSVVITLSTQC